ncbi:MAG: DUF2220 domain-containing protein [Spirochaetaceae bacterium]|jgi:hypothetical protein|nr:DUF2220 domain-containing protein [Spirochaetaceae bacterium]
MTSFEKQIINSFFERYVNSSSDPDKRIFIPADKVFPGFETASPDQKESFLEAAASLEKRGIFKLRWLKKRRKQAIRDIECINTDALFRLAGRPFPKAIAKQVKKAAEAMNREDYAPCCRELLNFIAENVSLTEIERGIDRKTFKDFAKLIKMLYENGTVLHKPAFRGSPYSVPDGMTPRALSVMLYNDAKRLNVIVKLFSRILGRANRQGIFIPDLSFLAPSFPETLVSGKIAIHFTETKTPLVNATGSIIGLPLETVKKVKNISVMKNGKKTETPSVLTIENKETFYALANSNIHTCALYTGGYPSRAVTALMQIFAISGFDFFHAGDVDPDGILILQELQKSVEKAIVPVCMDPATFHKYRKHGRRLGKSIINNLRFISDEMRSVEGIQDLISLIESTNLGIEQEFIDYGCNN